MMAFRDLKGVLQTIDLDTSLLSEQEKNDLIRRIKEVEGAIDAAADKVEEVGYSFTQNRGGNLFGFSQDDWALFFDNISAGKFGAEEMTMALLAAAEAANMAMDLYASYDKMMTAKENAELKKYKKNQDTKKKQLQSRLDAGLMTEEQHTQAVEQMEAEYERKQEELQIKQAKRQKAISLTNATISMAEGIAKAIAAYPWPLSLIPIAFATAMGTAQIAMISSTPITGAEEGGFPVERSQDGKRFNAHLDPDARGYIDRPTVLVGENGMEYVIPNEAMKNPTAAPIINTFEAVRRRGRLRDFDFTQTLPAMMRTTGYAAGGAISPGQAIDTINASPTVSTASEGSDPALVRLLYTAVVRLTERLDEPIRADVSLMGKAGLIEKQREYERMMNRGKLK